MNPIKGSHRSIEDFSPREFLKARRPEKFSDSAVEKKQALDRSVLEYHLSTLTSRSQETDFERFARRLAEKELCPNLLSHTGPTGGGEQSRMKDKLRDLLIQALARICYIEDVEKTLLKLFKDEHALERAVNYASSFVVLGNVLGLNDPDFVGVHEEDDLIIPEGQQNPPVKELMRWRQQRKNR